MTVIGCLALTAPAVAGAAMYAYTNGQESTGGATPPDTTVRVAGNAQTSDQSPFSYHFEYGTTTAYGSSTPGGQAPNGTLVSETITGLAPNTTYHFRFVAQSSSGDQAVGSDATAVTDPAPAPNSGVNPSSRAHCPPDDPQYPHRKLEADGCPPTYVALSMFVGSSRELLQDNRGMLGAQCDYNRGQSCVMHATVTLSASTARKAGIGRPRVTDLTIPLTTHAEQEDGLPDYGLTGGQPRQGRYHLGLSPAQKRKLGKLKSLTFTLRASYRLGSGSEISLGSKTITLSRTGFNESAKRLENHPGEEDPAPSPQG